jgi:nicotinate-nucleotide adenylyltransferase
LTRLGVFGGAFDPPHEAHLALATKAVAQLALDEMRVFPTGHAWHRAPVLSAPEHRLAMAKLAFDALPRTTVDDREIRRAGPTYTVDTLRELRHETPGVELFLIMGEDQAQAFTRWHEWAEIARIATLCVAHRGGNVVEPSVPGAKIVMLELPAMPVSATSIRDAVRRGEDISALVPPAVAGYIAAHHLYRGN